MNRAALQAAGVTAGRKLLVLGVAVAVVIVAGEVRTAALCVAAALPVICYLSFRTYRRVSRRLSQLSVPLVQDGTAPPVAHSLRDNDRSFVDMAQRLRTEARIANEHAAQAERAYEQLSAGIRTLISDLIGAEDATHALVGRDLHDTVKQSLLELEWTLDDPDNARRLLGQIRSEVEDIINRTSPIPAGTDLVAAVRNLVEDKAAASDLDIHIGHWVASADAELSEPVANTVYRFYQEALSNAAKHAPSSRVLITFDVTADGVTAHVADDGPGGLGSGPRQQGQHVGLAFMEQRARMLEGDLEIVSPPGVGTSLTLSLPAVS